MRIEYTNSHDVTVGTLVRGDADTLIVRPEAIQREARFLSRDVHDFAWWYQQPAWKLHPWFWKLAAILGVVLLLGAAGGGEGPDVQDALAHPDSGTASGTTVGVVILGVGALVLLKSIAPGGEWVHQPLDDVRFLPVAGAPAAPPDEPARLP